MLLTKTFIILQCVAFWPVWQWYVERMLDGSDEPWGIFSLISVLTIVTIRKTWKVLPASTIFICCIIITLYTVSYGQIPALFRGVLAMISLAVLISAISFGRTVQAGILGLMLLSLPLIASLQFYGGYPIRFITTFVSSHLVSLLGYEVHPQGTLLYWAGEVIAVDAPCAGIKMMWTGLFLNFTLATYRNLGFFSTWFSTSFTLFIVFIGNILRTTLLFFTESGIINAPDIAHQGIGIFVFALIAMTIISFHQYKRKAMTCA